jgi:hypothetical protein
MVGSILSQLVVPAESTSAQFRFRKWVFPDTEYELQTVETCRVRLVDDRGDVLLEVRLR